MVTINQEIPKLQSLMDISNVSLKWSLFIYLFIYLFNFIYTRIKHQDLPTNGGMVNYMPWLNCLACCPIENSCFQPELHQEVKQLSQACNSICCHCSSCYCFVARRHCFCCLFYCTVKGLQAILVRLYCYTNPTIRLNLVL